jgi:hypothetical protein
VLAIPLGPCTETPERCIFYLQPIATGRTVVVQADGATVTVNLNDLITTATGRSEPEVVAFLTGQPEGSAPIIITDIDATPMSVRYRLELVIAMMIDTGRVRVHDERRGRDVQSIVRETWEWRGEMGSQAGRRYRLPADDRIFFSVNDVFSCAF